MDYNKIRTFITVAEFGSISLAAKHLMRSQSAISQQIQSLESELGLKLLERKNAKILLSADGERILNFAKPNLNFIDDQMAEIKKSKSEATGHIRFGAHHNYSTNFDVGKIIGSFSKKYPKVTIDIIDGSSSDIENQLIENKLDLGLVIVFKSPELFIRHPISKASHSMYTSKEYEKLQGPFNKSKDVLESELIDLTEDFICFSAYFNKKAKKIPAALKHRKPNIIAPNFKIIKQIILSGYGVAMLPDFMMEGEKNALKLFSSTKSYFAGLDIAYRTQRTLRLSEKLFIEHFQNAI